MLRVLFALQQVFMVWVLVDAIRRRAEYHWFLVIVLPFGEWAYFFMVKVKDPEFLWLRNLFNPPKRQSLQELRDQFALTPSVANRMKLAQGLHDAGDFGAADQHLSALLAADPDDTEALYGHALCRLGLADTEAALAALEELVRKDKGFRDYAGWELLTRTLWEAQRKDEALASLAELWRSSAGTNHAVVYAQYLAEEGKVAEARQLLEQVLRELRVAPRYVKRRYWRWERSARELLRALPAAPSAAVS